MDLRTLVAPVRDSYVKAFERAVRDYKLNRSRHCVLEYSFGQPEEVEEGRFGLPMRHDLLPMADGEPASVTVIREERPAQVPETVGEVAGIPVTIHQFTWDQFEVHLAGVSRSANLTPLLDWFDRWFDRVGRRPEMAGGIRGVIHALDGPYWDEHGMMVEVDLGTATADAFVDLLHALSHLKPTAIEVLSLSLQQPGAAGWSVTAPPGWEQADEMAGDPITYTKDQSTFRVAIQEGAALNRNVDMPQLAEAVKQMAMHSGARKTTHVVGGPCPLGLYAATEWRTLEHGTIRLWMLTNRKDVITVSLIGDDLSQRDIRQVTDCVMAIAPKP